MREKRKIRIPGKIGQVNRRRLVVGIVFSAFLVCVAFTSILWSLTNRFGSEIAVGVANRLISKVGYGPIIRADVSLDIWDSSLTLSNVHLDFPQRGSVEADRLTVTLQPLQLFYNRLIIQRIDLLHPRVHWNLLAKRDVFNTKVGSSASDLAFDIIVKKIDLRRGEVLLESGGEDPSVLTDIRLSASYDKAGNDYPFVLESGSGRVATSDLNLPVNLFRVSGRGSERGVAVHSLKVFLPEMELEANGSLDGMNSKTGTFQANLNIPLEKVSEAIPSIPKLKGNAEVALSFDGGVDHPELKGTIKLADGWIETFRLEDIELAFDVNRMRAHLNGSVCHFAQGVVTLEQAELRFEEGYPIDIRAKLDNVELGHVLSNVTDLHSKVMQWQTGTAFMSGKLVPFKMQGRAKLDVRGHQVKDVGYRKWPKGMDIVGVNSAKVDVGLFVDDSCFEIQKGTAKFGNTVVDVNVVHFGFDSIFHMDYSSTQFDMSDLETLLELPVQGQGSLSCIIHGPSDDPTITAWVDMEDFGIADYRLGHTKMDVWYYDEVLKLSNATIRKGIKSVYHASMGFDFKREGPYTWVNAATENLDIQDLLDVIGRKDDLGGILEGRITGAGSLSGPLGRFSGEARLVLPEFTTHQQSFDTARADFRLEQNDLLIKKLELRKGSGLINVSGQIKDLDQLDLRFQSKRMSISDLDVLSFLFGDAAKGETEFSGSVRGTRANTIVQAQLLIDEMQIGKELFEPSEIHAEWTAQYLDLDAIFFNRKLKASALFSFDQHQQVQIEAKASDFRYGFLLSKLLDLTVEDGSVSGSLSGTIPLKHPEKTTGTVQIENVTGTYRSIPLKNKSRATLNLANGVFRLDPVDIIGKDISMEVRGDIDLNGNLDLIFNGESDWRQLVELNDLLENGQGPVSLSFNLGGQWENLQLSGQASFRRSTLKIKDVDPLYNLRGTIQVNGDQLALDRVSFRYLGGTVSINGNVFASINDGSLKRTDLFLNLDKVAFRLGDGMIPLVSGQLALNGTPWPMSLSGNVTIDELNYTKSFNLTRTLFLDRVEDLIRPKKKRMLANQKPYLKYNIGIRGNRTIRIRNNLADIRLTADLRLVGTDVRTGLLNTLSADRGLIFFQRNEFDIVRFMIEFVEKDQVYPVWDILAETSVDYIDDDKEKLVNITLHVKGNLDEPEISLESDAGLTRDDIISLLLIGQPMSKLQEESSVATGLNALSDIYGVNDTIKSQFKLDEFRLTSEFDNANSTSGIIVPKLVIGKEVADNIYLSFSTTIGEQETNGEQQFEIKYRLKYFTLSGAWDNNSVQAWGNFGADLKFHLDF